MAPQTGPLVFIGLPQFAAVRQAVATINTSGGVLGHAVTVEVGTDAGTQAQVLKATRHLVAQHPDAVIGAPGTAVTAFDQLLQSSGIAQCAPASTAPVTVVRPMGALSARTVPPNDAVAPVLAAQATATGAKVVAILARNDAYGHSMADAVAGQVTAHGGTVAVTSYYNPAAPAGAPAVAQVAAAKPSAVVLISFNEGGSIVNSLLQAGVKPAAIVGSPGTYLASFNTLVDPQNHNLIDGMTAVGIGGSAAFDQALGTSTGGEVSYGAQSFDCAIIIALAAVQAKSPAPAGLAKHMAEVTNGQNVCTTFARCLALLKQGKSIAYQGPSGPIKLNSNNDPTSGRVIVGQFIQGILTQTGATDVPVNSPGH